MTQPLCRTDSELALRVTRWAFDAFPVEACGLLFGGSSADSRRSAGSTWVADAVRCRNVAAAPERGFELDPLEHLRVEESARERGLELVGVWHSHPAGPPVPSAADHFGAWPGSSWWIVSAPPGHAPRLRAWRRMTLGFIEERFEQPPALDDVCSERRALWRTIPSPSCSG